ncbi:cytochrome P450 monooxygenase-like protein [Lasiosphaeria hispida]|uniref:Cytochrome P450 monooxygenase-like protein n=1 Tax=Lasiosphaeria hispida TaxID=260671 RepID=A0AAJ0HL28_9PEZI|nr:cytochrome P450 monooxygenase-like protein [Lasiosphaeria hispida]
MVLANLAAILAVASGVAAHVFLFRIGEWDVASPSVFLTYVSMFSAAALASRLGFLCLPMVEIARLCGYHALGLYGSMLFYRAFFHRLAKYPGPLLARLTNFYITALSMKKLHMFEEVQKLHAQYGDIVRLGPRELSIADPEAVRAIYGSQSPVTKGPWYTLLEPRIPLFMARDKQEHARRRKVWDQGFSTKALQGYEPRITKAIDQFLVVIRRNVGRPLDVNNWFAYFAFDIIEDLAFNKSSNMLGDGKETYIFQTIRADMFNIALFTHLPWLLPFLKRTPLLNNNYLRFWDWIQNKIEERSKNEPDQPDIFSWILKAYGQSAKTQRDRYNLHGDAQLIVIAGSDSVAATLTYVFFHLAYDPELVRMLQAELDALPDLAHDRLAAVALLDAVVNEAMRLHPPVPSGTQRVTPPEGLQIGKAFVPGDTIVQVPSYTVFRDERAFELPNEFIPERWTTRPELIRDKSVFIPFNSGPYGCVGKRLALMEIRRLVAEILWRYDVRIAPGQCPEAFLDGKQDVFTTVSAPLPVIFTERVGTGTGTLPGRERGAYAEAKC